MNGFRENTVVGDSLHWVSIYAIMVYVDANIIVGVCKVMISGIAHQRLLIGSGDDIEPSPFAPIEN